MGLFEIVSCSIYSFRHNVLSFGFRVQMNPIEGLFGCFVENCERQLSRCVVSVIV